MTNSALLAVIYALCVYRLTHLVTGDALTDPAREWLRDRSHEVQVRTITERGNEKVEERLGENPGVALWVWRWATCPWCVSPWIGAACVLGWDYAASWFNLVAAVFALSAVAGVLSERV